MMLACKTPVPKLLFLIKSSPKNILLLIISISTVPNQDNRNGRYGYQNMATAGDSSSGNLRVFID